MSPGTREEHHPLPLGTQKHQKLIFRSTDTPNEIPNPPKKGTYIDK